MGKRTKRHRTWTPEQVEESGRDRWPGPTVPHIRITYEELDVLREVPECAFLYLIAIAKRCYQDYLGQKKGTFKTTFLALAAELGRPRQTVERQAKRLWRVNLLRWTGTDNQRKPRVFWLPSRPIPERTLRDLESRAWSPEIEP